MEAEATGNAVTPETQAVRFHLSKFRSLRDFTGADVTKERVLEEKKGYESIKEQLSDEMESLSARYEDAKKRAVEREELIEQLENVMSERANAIHNEVGQVAQSLEAMLSKGSDNVLQCLYASAVQELEMLFRQTQAKEGQQRLKAFRTLRETLDCLQNSSFHHLREKASERFQERVEKERNALEQKLASALQKISFPRLSKAENLQESDVDAVARCARRLHELQRGTGDPKLFRTTASLLSNALFVATILGEREQPNTEEGKKDVSINETTKGSEEGTADHVGDTGRTMSGGEPNEKESKERVEGDRPQKEESSGDVMAFRALFSALEEKFVYHFEGSKATARLDKPEWAFTYLLNVAKDTVLLLDHQIQLVINEDEKTSDISAKEYFNCGLVLLAVRRVLHDWKTRSLAKGGKEVLLCHAVRELSAFDAELRTEIPLLKFQPSALAILFDTCPSLYDRWLECENEERKDTLLQLAESPDAFAPIVEFKAKNLVEESRIEDEALEETTSQLADALSATAADVLSLCTTAKSPAITKRVLKTVLEPVLMAVFSKIAEAAQVTAAAAATKKLVTMANTCEECAEAIAELDDHPVIFDTVEGGTAGSEKGEEGRFGVIADEYRELFRKITTDMITENDFQGFRAKFQRYIHVKMRQNFASRKEKWDKQSSMDQSILDERPSLSPELCDAVELLSALLNERSRQLRKRSFGLYWRRMATSIQKLFIDSICFGGKNRRFSPSSVSQLSHDVQVLFNGFRPYARRPENVMRKLKEIIDIMEDTDKRHKLAIELQIALQEVDAATSAGPEACPVESIEALKVEEVKRCLKAVME